ncbi:MAG: hypothetical protein AB3N14_13170 [Flavobacteriaceae bacterium]
MSYKVKSLLYFTCFLVAITMYYSMDNNIQIEPLNNNVELAEADLNDISSDKLIELEEVK